MNLYGSVLITGGGGMLARSLHELLLARNIQPAILTRAQLDITNREALREVFGITQPTLLLNCAAHTKVDLCEQEKDLANAVNGTAVGEMARLCRECGAAMVHVSTDFVFDGSLRRPYQPNDPVHPINVYGSSKLLGEVELQKNGPQRWLIVRTSWVYGRGGVNFPRTMVQAAQAGKPLKVVSDQLGCPTYSHDLAEAILKLLDTNAAGIWHICNSGITNWHDFATATLKEFGIDKPIEPLTSAQWKAIRPQACERPNYSVLDNAPYAQQTGKPMRGWREALVDFHLAVDAGGF